MILDAHFGYLVTKHYIYMNHEETEVHIETKQNIIGSFDSTTC